MLYGLMKLLGLRSRAAKAKMALPGWAAKR